MPEERKHEVMSERKALLLARSEVLREQAGDLWHEADRPLRALEAGAARLRRLHPVAYGAAGIGIFLMRRKLLEQGRLLGPLLSLGWVALEMAVSRNKERGRKTGDS